MKTDALKDYANTTPGIWADNNDPSAVPIRQFALDNGFSYTPSNKELVSHSSANHKYAPAWLGMVALGMSKTAYHIVSGDYKGYPLWIFLMRKDGIGSSQLDELIGVNGASQLNEALMLNKEYATYSQSVGIVRIQLPKTFPQVLLDSSKNDRVENGIKTSNIQAEYLSSQYLRLEGDFDNYFDLYAPIGLQINVLTLLAPNMMQILKDHAGLIDVEFYGNEMVLITHDNLYSADIMKALSQAIDEQLKYLDRLMSSWNYIPKVQPFDRLQRPIVIGNVVKVGKFRISSATQLAIMLGVFVLFGLLIIILKAFSTGQ